MACIELYRLLAFKTDYVSSANEISSNHSTLSANPCLVSRSQPLPLYEKEEFGGLLLELSRYYEISIKTETIRYDTIIELLSMNVDYRPITICARAVMCACSVH